jgi:hypothetical protein
MSIQAVVTQVQTSIASTVTKISYAPAYATDVRLSAPTTIVFADNIKFKRQGGWNQTIFDVKIDVFVPQMELADALQWLDGVPAAIANIFRSDPTISATCDTYEGDITASFARQVIDETDCVGYSMTIPNVKIMNE